LMSSANAMSTIDHTSETITAGGFFPFGQSITTPTGGPGITSPFTSTSISPLRVKPMPREASTFLTLSTPKVAHSLPI
jgi:hypothetical protein